MNEEIMCGLCGASLWIDTINGQHHLMRLAEIEIEDCPICTKMHEAIK